MPTIYYLVDSSNKCNTLLIFECEIENFFGRLEPESLPGSLVKNLYNFIDSLLGDSLEARPLREILPHQPV